MSQKNIAGANGQTTSSTSSDLKSSSPKEGRKLKFAHVRFNVDLYGEPASWVIEWRARGLVSSKRDVLLQSLRTLREKFLDMELTENQLERFNRERRP